MTSAARLGAVLLLVLACAFVSHATPTVTRVAGCYQREDTASLTSTFDCDPTPGSNAQVLTIFGTELDTRVRNVQLNYDLPNRSFLSNISCTPITTTIVSPFTQLECRLVQGGYGAELNMTVVTAGSPQIFTPANSDVLVSFRPPVITSTEGDSKCTTAGGQAYYCTGGALITIRGLFFGPLPRLSYEPTLKVEVVDPVSGAASRATITTTPSTGQVIFALPLNMSGTNLQAFLYIGNQRSVLPGYVGYNPPTIIGMSTPLGGCLNPVSTFGQGTGTCTTGTAGTGGGCVDCRTDVASTAQIRLSLTGSNFGSVARTKVWVGPWPCNVTTVTTTTIGCLLYQGGMGANNTVRVVIGGTTSNLGYTLTFRRPVVHNLTNSDCPESPQPSSRLVPGNANSRLVLGLGDCITTGGSILTIRGQYFGNPLAARDSRDAIFIGDRDDLCTGVRWISDQEATCNLQEGYGADLSVQPYVAGQLSLSAKPQLSFAAPIITTITTAAGPLGGTVTCTVSADLHTSEHCSTRGGDWLILNVTNLGPKAAIYVGGIVLAMPAGSPATSGQIAGIVPAGAGGLQRIRVVVSSQESAETVPFYVAYDGPTVISVSGCVNQTIDSLSTYNCLNAGGEMITVLGSNFGPTSTGVEISFGPPTWAKCTQTLHVPTNPHNQLTCVLPAGATTKNGVIVTILTTPPTSSDYRATLGVHVSYVGPVVLAVTGCADTPTGTFNCAPGGGTAISISGVAFGTGAPGVLIGTQPCSSVELTATGATCVLPPGAGVQLGITICPEGQASCSAPTSVPSGPFVGYLPPVLTAYTGCGSTAAPCKTVGGDTIQLTGTTFGTTGSQQRVTIGGRQCTPSGTSTDTSINCVTPYGVGVQDLVLAQWVDDVEVATTSLPFTYATPVVSSITGCLPGSRTNATECLTSGNQEIIITGTNLGADNDDVELIFTTSGTPVYEVRCVNPLFTQPQLQLRCQLSSGWGRNNILTYRAFKTVNGLPGPSPRTVGINYVFPHVTLSFARPQLWGLSAAITDCSGNSTLSPVSVFDCPTVGGVPVTIRGSNFGPESVVDATGANVSVPIRITFTQNGIVRLCDPANIQRISLTEVVCLVLPAGTGCANVAQVWIGNQESLETDSLVGYGAPTVTTVTASAADCPSGPLTVGFGNIGNCNTTRYITVTITGTNFGPAGSQLSVTLAADPGGYIPGPPGIQGPSVLINCVNVTQSATSPQTLLTARCLGGGKSMPVVLSTHVDGTCLPGFDDTSSSSITASFVVPSVTSISGCAGWTGVSDGAYSTTECLRAGGNVITIRGSFLGSTGVTGVTVNSHTAQLLTPQLCTNVVVAANGTSLTCLFPKLLTDSANARRVVVWQGNQPATGPVLTAAYTLPHVTRVTGCSSNDASAGTDGVAGTRNCGTIGSTATAPVRITVTGQLLITTTNAPSVSVTVAGRTCANPTVTPPNEVVCDLPSWAGTNLSVVVTVGVDSSPANAALSYVAPIATGFNVTSGFCVLNQTAGTAVQCRACSGALITVFGDQFGPTEAGATIVIGSHSTSDCVVSALQTQVVCTLPSANLGYLQQVAVVVSGTSTVLYSARPLTLSYLRPYVTSVSCGGHCDPAGQSGVTITGHNFGSSFRQSLTDNGIVPIVKVGPWVCSNVVPTGSCTDYEVLTCNLEAGQGLALFATVLAANFPSDDSLDRDAGATATWATPTIFSLAGVAANEATCGTTPAFGLTNCPSTGTKLTITGANFGPVDSRNNVTAFVGLKNHVCSAAAVTVAQTEIVCTAGPDQGTNLDVGVAPLGNPSLEDCADDSICLSYIAPTITGLIGCGLTSLLGSTALAQCPTHGERITIVGRWLGSSIFGEVPEIYFERPTAPFRSNCTNPVIAANQTSVQCDLAGAGSGWTLSYVVGGNAVPTPLAVSFRGPLILSVTGCTGGASENPVQTWTADCPTAGNVTITISGDHFGPSNAYPIDYVRYGKAEYNCTNAVHDSVVPNERIYCTLAAGIGRLHNVTVSVDGQVASGTTGQSISYQTPRLLTLTSASPLCVSTRTGLTSCDTLGTQVVTITGRGFGKPANSAQVVVSFPSDAAGLIPCSSVAVLSDTNLTCRLPPATGANRPLRVSVGNNAAQSNFLTLSYRAPVLSNVTGCPGSPASNVTDTCSTHAPLSTLVITGSNFGQIGGFAPVSGINIVVTYGPYKCEPVTQLASQTKISCPMAAGVGSHKLKLSVGGQIAEQPAFVAYAPPLITKIAGCQSVSDLVVGECLIAGGTRLNLTGDFFGTTADAVTITVGGAPCALVGRPPLSAGGAPVNNTALYCITPVGTGKSVPVVVTVGGQSSIPALLSYQAPKVELVSAGASVCPGGCQRCIDIVNSTTQCDTRGGVELTVRGLRFGAVGSKFEIVVGGVVCNNSRVTVANVEGRCTLPAGLGVDLPVVVRTNSLTGVLAESPELASVRLSYAAPTIDYVHGCTDSGSSTTRCPTSGLLVSVRGNFFGAASTFSTTAVTLNTLAGTVLGTCTTPKLSLAHVLIVCQLPEALGQRRRIQVCNGPVRNRQCASAPTTALVSYSPPVITAVRCLSSDSSLNCASEGETLIINGNALGSTGGSVTVNGEECTGLMRSVAHKELRCTLPSGQGSNLPVVVLLGEQQATPTKVISYILPTLSGVSPASSAFTVGGTVLTITGTNFGTDPKDINITVSDSLTCEVLSVDNRQITCTLSGGVGTAHTVSVSVGGGTAVVAGSFSYQKPSIVSLSGCGAAVVGDVASQTSCSAGGADTLTIAGANFGCLALQTLAVAAPSVALLRSGADAVACGNVNCISDSELTCQLPASLQGVYTPVVVVGGQASASPLAGVPTIEYENALSSVTWVCSNPAALEPSFIQLIVNNTIVSALIPASAAVDACLAYDSVTAVAQRRNLTVGLEASAAAVDSIFAFNTLAAFQIVATGSVGESVSLLPLAHVELTAVLEGTDATRVGVSLWTRLPTGLRRAAPVAPFVNVLSACSGSSVTVTSSIVSANLGLCSAAAVFQIVALSSSTSLFAAGVETFVNASGRTAPTGWRSVDLTLDPYGTKGRIAGAETWRFDNLGKLPAASPLVAPFATFDAFFYSSHNDKIEDVTLESAKFSTFSVAGLGTTTCVALSFDQWIAPGPGAAGLVEVYTPISGWQNVKTFTEASANADLQVLDITRLSGELVLAPTATNPTYMAIARGSDNMRVRFRWISDASFFWIVDNVNVFTVPC